MRPNDLLALLALLFGSLFLPWTDGLNDPAGSEDPPKCTEVTAKTLYNNTNCVQPSPPFPDVRD